MRMIVGLALALSLMLLPRVGQAQDAKATTTAIMHQSVNYLAIELLKAPVTIDPREFDGRGLSLPGVAVHSPAALAGVDSAGVSAIATLDRAIDCWNVSRPQCKTNGRANFVRLGTPIVRGDSAKLQVFIRSAKDPTSQDSATLRARHIRAEIAVRQPGCRGPPMSIYDSANALARMTNGVGGMHVELSLVRVNGNWKVVAHKVLGAS
jgi:hypothetical protein